VVTSGIKGYSYTVDNKSNTEVDNKVDITSAGEITFDYSTKTKYIHIKAIDNAGNYSETYHFEISELEGPPISDAARLQDNKIDFIKNLLDKGVKNSNTGKSIKRIIPKREANNGGIKVVQPNGIVKKRQVDSVNSPSKYVGVKNSISKDKVNKKANSNIFIIVFVSIIFINSMIAVLRRIRNK